MILIKYNDSNTFNEVSFLRSDNLVTGTPTTPNTSGFTTWKLDGVTQLGDFLDFAVVYRIESNSITYSNDGGIYVGPQCSQGLEA